MANRSLAVAVGLLFALYPVLRPYSTETGVAGANAFASPLWVAAHLAGAAGFLALGLLVRAHLPGSAAETVMWVGVALTLPYYGAETFALHALGVRAQETGDVTLVDLSEPIRYGLVQTTMFGAGLICIAVGVVLLARRIGGPGPWLLAAGFVLFLPQFFVPFWLRMAHGLLIFVGALWLGGLWSAGPWFAGRSAHTRQEISTTTGA